ncbi:MAG: serine/threonine protein kinase, partial [Leptolyngbya sp.]|nr:serine/threonine protein kinase [Candidatus Melainabacteria bacterium]
SRMKIVIEKLGQSALAKDIFANMQKKPTDAIASHHCDECGKTYDTTIKLCPEDGSFLAPITDTDLHDTIFEDKYQIDKCIGRGGGGIIYKAHHRYFDRTVAIKILNPKLSSDFALVKRFKREAETASSLRHDNLMSVYDFGISKRGQPYFIMEYIEGKTLRELIVENSELNLESALPIFLQICDGLDYAHSKGVIHRDLKPSNIMLIDDGQGRAPKVKIIDFGIAKDTHVENKNRASLTLNGEIFGSPPFMSPEQCRGQSVDCRSDIYSMGCLMFETLTGVHLFPDDSTLATLFRHLNEAPRACREILPDNKFPDEIERIIQKTLEKDPDDRYQTMRELKNDLKRVAVEIS